MPSYYPAALVKRADESLIRALAPGVPMRRAAFGLAQVVLRELRDHAGGAVGQKVWLVVGVGDNGADALWAGAFLKRRGVDVRALLLNPRRAHPAGLAAFRRAGGKFVDDVPDAPAPFGGGPGRGVVVDGVVGLSGKGPLRGHAAEIFSRPSGHRVVAVDLPSGVDPDTGAVAGPAVTADVTVAMGVFKQAHALNPGRCGRLELVDIGYPEAGFGPLGVLDGARGLTALGQERLAALLPAPGPGDDKYTQGVLGVVAGSPTYPGAGALCASGALATTSGMVRAVGPGAKALVAVHPELVVSEDVESTGRVNAWVLGPGADESTRALLLRALATDLPVVADASALRLVPDAIKRRSAPTVVTPHEREFEAFAGRPVGADRAAAAAALATECGATVLLKGHVTIIAEPGGQVLVNIAGNSWAATAGSGDVLSGMIGALLASAAAEHAAPVAAAIHSRAAALAAGAEPGAPITASALAARIPDAIRSARASGLARRTPSVRAAGRTGDGNAIGSYP
ncbi:carbohydrate kinase, YjeF related protein [Segniliparus rotundus DSM 44985]|uniref:ADP-dependent (S)-NAD(P)H-hydrate dehydratase n=1 Tax=Segniliparus rotundus (strain ATCC BAA-972 / CDC 1076 / CIP 108378 / DSM 44985 / JCM 13578) TaxID=640132 RepID=D6ZB80_SEGRD|nr:NAD(P)H-hydrate dehydratase [Segniliparus rotundus]ADG96839.1 carbohydrate kinase, YjeF related protein [Segniliparus rotundus DSM 44985]